MREDMEIVHCIYNEIISSRIWQKRLILKAAFSIR